MRRFFIPISQIDGDSAVITGTDAHQLARVLRKTPGDTIEATDGMGHRITAVIRAVDENTVQLDITASESVEERRVGVRLFQAIPKGDKFDWIIEKACELGVQELIPLITERTIPDYDPDKGLKKRVRWEKIAQEAMKQVGRSTEMIVAPIIRTRDIPSVSLPGAFKIVPWENEDRVTLKESLREYNHMGVIEVLIGPEGGLSMEEVERLKEWGFRSVSLGKRILKVETATITALGNLFYELE